MPVILSTVDEYVVKVRKRDSFWVVFNSHYNNIHAYKLRDNNTDFYLNKDFTDEVARKEFLEFMKKNFPNIKLVDVFDLVNSSYVVFPFLGSILIECEKDDEVFNKLSEKYGNPYDDVIGNNSEENYTKNVVFWTIDLENAQKFYDEKNNYDDI